MCPRCIHLVRRDNNPDSDVERIALADIERSIQDDVHHNFVPRGPGFVVADDVVST